MIGFFCDAEAGLEGARIYEEGREALRERVSWAQLPDPRPEDLADSVAQMLQLRRARDLRAAPQLRPPLTLALEALHQEQPVEDAALRRQALDVLGHTGDELAEQILLRFLESEDWVDRTHAVRAYVRQRRPFGEAGRPTVDTLMDDPDESVREALFEGLKELIAAVEFSDQVAHDQIDAAIRRGLADEDEDVQAAAAEAQELRKSLLG
ncbi:MAG: HEAT repeat domain-containing protein [Planctomycetota bacterium]